jgi:uncharacterized protein YjbI with pentapeptide repeats
MDYVEILRQGVDQWNAWREKNPTIKPVVVGGTIDMDLTKVDLRGAKIVDVDFSNARLSSADFSGSTISRCRFEHADLSGADLSCIECAQTSFKGSNLARCLLSGSLFSNCSFNHATGEGITITPFNQQPGVVANVFASDRFAEFRKCDFGGVEFPHILAEAKIKKCTFCGARLSTADFRKSDIRGCDFSSAQLEHAEFTEATVSKSNFREAVMPKASFRKASLRDVDFRGASCSLHTDFAMAHFTKVRMEHADLAEAQLPTILKADQVRGLVLGSDLIYLKRSFTGFRRWLHLGALLVFAAPYAIYIVRIEVGHEVIRQTQELKSNIGDYLASAIDRSTSQLISAITTGAPDQRETQNKQRAYNESETLKWNVSQYLSHDSYAAKAPLYSLVWDYIQHHDSGSRPDWLDIASRYFFYFLLAYNLLRIVILFKTSSLEHQEEVLNLNFEFSFLDYPTWGLLYHVMMSLTLPYYVVIALHTWQYVRAERYFVS